MKHFFFAHRGVLFSAMLLMFSCWIGDAQEAPLATPSTQAADTGKAAAAKPNPDAKGNRHVGDGVTPPVPISLPGPEFSRELRKQKMSGNTLVGLTVDLDGKPQDVHVVRSMAEGLTGEKRDQALALDQKAVEAVRQYKFRPSTTKGKPVAVKMNVDVHFEIN